MTTEYRITEPGVYDIPEDVYHADPVPGGSLSVSGAKKLLPPSCPALFAYERANPRPPTSHMELGTAAHNLVLGVGQPLKVVDADSYTTKAAREERDGIRAAGGVPLLPAEWAQVQAMAAAIRAEPLAAALLNRDRGEPERSIFWHDQEWGVWRRCRVDFLPYPTPAGLIIVTDYKTCKSASPKALPKQIADFGYHMQDAWYRDAVAAMFPGADVRFLFIFQEKNPPYLVTVSAVDEDTLRAGQAENRRALEVYRDCTEADAWPGYADDVVTVRIPGWAFPREHWL